MEALNMEIIAVLLCGLAFGSSLIHYTAFAKSKAKVVVRKGFK